MEIKNDENHYNHYWMQAILKNGWADENDNVFILNTQDLFFKFKPNNSYDFRDVFEKRKKEKTNNILGSQVISLDTEKLIGVPKIETDMLSFLHKKDNNLDSNDVELLKKYCHLQVIRNPLLYDLIIKDLDLIIECEEKMIKDCGGDVITQDKSFKIQSFVNSMVELVSQDKYYSYKMNNKRVKIIDISEYKTGFVIGDMTLLSFTSSLNNKTIMDSFKEFNNIEYDISPLCDSYIFPITQSSFIYLFENDIQLNILNKVLEKLVFYQNKLQLELSSKVILPRGIAEERIFNNMNFQHSLQLDKVKPYVNNNLIMLLNKQLYKRKADEYFKDYEKTLVDINSLSLIKKTSFIELKESFKDIFNSNDEAKISFGLLTTYDDLEYLCKDVFIYNIENKQYIFFVMKSGTVLYSINNSGFGIFCSDYFDFNGRFIIELAINKIIIPLNLVQKLRDVIGNSHRSSWNIIAEKQLMNPLTVTLIIEIDILKNKEL